MQLARPCINLGKVIMADATGTGVHPSHLTDNRLSLEAKGLFTIILNTSFEEVWFLFRKEPDFEIALGQLQHNGYIGKFGFDAIEICAHPVVV